MTQQSPKPSHVTVGILVKANEDAAIFDTLGNMNEWVELHVLNAVTGLPIPMLRSAPRIQYNRLRDEIYGDDPISTKFRVSNSETPWDLIECTCACGCLLICVDHIDDQHTNPGCPQTPILRMRRITTDDIISSSSDQGINVIKIYGRISSLSEAEIAALPSNYYWALQSGVSRAITDPLWPDDLNTNALVEQWRALSPEISSSKPSTS